MTGGSNQQRSYDHTHAYRVHVPSADGGGDIENMQQTLLPTEVFHIYIYSHRLKTSPPTTSQSN
jgi:hypothetical protein